MDILGSQAGAEKEATLREAMAREESGRDFAKSRIYSLLTLIQECALQSVHLQRAPSVRVSKPKCPKFRRLSENPNISMNFSGQRHCLASGMCKICAINIFRNI